jgi:hypothetical protein
VPTSAPTASGVNTLYFSQSPLTTPLANLSYTTLPSSAMQTTWNEEGFGPARHAWSDLPLYISSQPSDTVVTVVCTMYGSNCMNGATVKVHVNPADVVQAGSDHHILIEDPQLGVAVDCWKAAYTANYTVSLANGQLSCGWGGAYKFGSTGLKGSYSNEASGGEGFHFGPASGTFLVTPQELLSGVINHAIALNASCLNGQDVYPANNTQPTDSTCDGSSNPPHYGNAIQLNWSQAKIDASPYSVPCKAILTAERVYGAYFSDTGDDGTMIDTQSERTFAADPAEMGQDLWPAVPAELQSAGDADSSGNWTDCFNRLSASDFNLIQLNAP